MQNLTNEEQVVVIQARTVLTLAEKVTAAEPHDEPWCSEQLLEVLGMNWRVFSKGHDSL